MTVSTRAIITGLYSQLPDNGSELVLFDLNRTIKFGPLLSTGADFILTYHALHATELLGA